MGFIQNIIQEGELPVIKTEVAIEKDSINRLAVTFVVVALIVVLAIGIVKKVGK